MAFDTKEQQLVRWGVQNGKTKQEIEDAIINLRSGYAAAAPTPIAPKKPSIVGDLAIGAAKGAGQVIQETGDLLQSGLKNNTLSRIVPGAQEAIQRGGDAIQDAVGLNDENLLADGTAQKIGKGAAIAASIVGPAVGPAAGRLLTKGAEHLAGIAAKGAEGIQQAAAHALDPADIMQRVARISKGKQAGFQERAGKSVGQYLVDNGIFGDVDDITGELFTRFQKSKDEVDTALASLPGNFRSTAIGSALKQLLEREARVSSPGAVSRDTERVRELSKKHGGEGLSMTEINDVKRLFERNVRLDYVKANVPDKVENATNLDRAIREWQQSTASQLGFKNIQQLNKETMLAKQLLDDLGAEYAGSAGNNAITLTDWIVLGGGSPAAAAGFLAKRAISSKGIQAKLAKFLSPPAKLQPTAEMTTATIDKYLEFLRRTSN